MSSSSPVLPSGSDAQLRHRSFSGMGERYSSCISSSCWSWSSMIFRKNIQQSWEMRWASPSTPESWRMMSCIALTVLRTDISSSFHLVQGGLEFIYCKHEVRASAEFLNQLHGC